MWRQGPEDKSRTMRGVLQILLLKDKWLPQHFELEDARFSYSTLPEDGSARGSRNHMDLHPSTIVTHEPHGGGLAIRIASANPSGDIVWELRAETVRREDFSVLRRCGCTN
jgi:hypothetical protein